MTDRKNRMADPVSLLFTPVSNKFLLQPSGLAGQASTVLFTTTIPHFVEDLDISVGRPPSQLFAPAAPY